MISVLTGKTRRLCYFTKTKYANRHVVLFGNIFVIPRTNQHLFFLLKALLSLALLCLDATNVNFIVLFVSDERCNIMRLTTLPRLLNR